MYIIYNDVDRTRTDGYGVDYYVYQSSQIVGIYRLVGSGLLTELMIMILTSMTNVATVVEAGFERRLEGLLF